ncbi:hypothetical protein [Flavobacterium sp. I3-2]|uniref:hypothetical protein n=1 Tax=Flavobacterium sp. I3-2 TaxID=2748319 RepID=UPI0015B2F6C6|nr:hypothetical protein [Flavobacterium sp. I3-2]
MREFKSLKIYTILIGIVIVINAIFSVIEILNIWKITKLEFVEFNNLKFQFYTTTDKLIATTYQLLNIALLIPIILFYKISNQFKNGFFF